MKDYADKLKDGIEELREITRVDMVGALEKEIQVDVDKYKMAAASLTLRPAHCSIIPTLNQSILRPTPTATKM